MDSYDVKKLTLEGTRMANLCGYVGGMKQGKTILAIADCYHEYLHDKRKIRCNLTLHFPRPAKQSLVPTKRFSLFDLVQFMDKPDSEWQNLTLLWDEIYLNLECRLSGAQELNRIGSYFVFQSGKRDVFIRWTSQMFGSPDNRIRWATLEVGQLVKAKGVFVNCMLKSSNRINAEWCWKKRCPHLNYCVAHKDFIARYAIWKGTSWRYYRLHNVQQYFNFYDAGETISMRETERVQAYLQARRSIMRKEIREVMKDKFRPESIKEFTRELENMNDE